MGHTRLREGLANASRPASAMISTRTPELSLVVPCYNEADGLDPFFARVEPLMQRLGVSYEIVCVNDGSRDDTLAGLRRHRERNPRLRVVDLSRNFGKEIASTAGLDHARGRAAVLLDADLQDPPELIEPMLSKWREGFDVVLARRSCRMSDSFLKRSTARAFYRTFNRMADVAIPVDVGDYRLMDRKVLDALARFPESNRFLKGLGAWVGFRTAVLDYERPARLNGESSFNYRKLLGAAAAGIIAFSSAPLRFWGYLGAGISLISLLYAFFLIFRTLILGTDVPGYASLMVAILFFGGVQLLSLGILGEYLSRIYNETKRRPLYLVREIIETDPPHTG